MNWQLYFSILGFLLCWVPLIWETVNDSDGDAHISRAKVFEPYQLLSKKVDVIARIVFALGAGLFDYLVNDRNFFKSVFLAFSAHFFLFDYLIAYILIRREIIVGHWFTYLGSKGMDNIYHWRSMDPRARLALRAFVFALALWLYF